MSKAMIKNSTTGEWEDRSIEILHGLTVAHYTKLGLYGLATARKQLLYACGEAGELGTDGVLKNDLTEIEDGIGDVSVCLINWAHLEGVDFMGSYQAGVGCGYTPYAGQDSEALCLRLHHRVSTAKNGVDLVNIIGILDALAKAYNLTLADCLGCAYDVVSKRRVKPLNGTLVKEANWHKHPELEGVEPL